MKRLLLGNEALALGAYGANVTVATGYPGTPSTEILEHFARYPGVYAEWSPNEKVALEVGMGAALAGARTIVIMKHVGLNVAADPFFAAAYIGVKGGLVIVSADDPGMHSSQGEQDNRNYARFAKVPLLEPSDSQECFDMMRLGLEMSEEYDTPVLLRTTGRISHAQSLVQVEMGDRPKVAPAFERQPAKYVMLPANARRQRVALEQRLARLKDFAETSPVNRVHWGDRKLGVVSSSIAYQYAREAFPDASFLKLGMSYPLPAALIAGFAREVEQLVVIEELDPFLEEQIRALPELAGRRIIGREVFPGIGELSTEAVVAAAAERGLLPAGGPAAPAAEPIAVELPPRPPVLCPGCPHRATFHILRRLTFAVGDDSSGDGGSRRRERVIVSGDIGCYTLGALPPLGAMDTTSCMGASIGHALGMEKAGLATKVVAVIGDSTFYHSGVTGLMDVVASGASTTVVILDNGTTAMTGGNANPGSGCCVTGEPAQRIPLEDVCRGLGVADVEVLPAYDIAQIEQQLRRALQAAHPSVMIVRGPCVLKERVERPHVSRVDAERCTGCWACLRTGCPALVRDGETARIIASLCTGCSVCNQVCPQDAILDVAREEVAP